MSDEENFDEMLESEEEFDSDEDLEDLSDSEGETLFPDEDLAPSATELKRSTSFQCIPEDTIFKQSQKIIHDVVQLCNIPTEAAAATLLRAFKLVFSHFTERSLISHLLLFYLFTDSPSDGTRRN